MHELALTKDIVDVVARLAEAEGAKEVKAVHLTIGEGRDLVPPLFRAFFKRFAEGTVLEGADLVINRKPLRVKCGICSRVHSVDVRDQETWSCPGCGGRSHELYSGMELLVDYLEVA